MNLFHGGGRGFSQGRNIWDTGGINTVEELQHENVDVAFVIL